MDTYLEKLAKYRNNNYIISLSQTPIEIYNCNIYDKNLKLINDNIPSSDDWNLINQNNNLCCIIITDEINTMIKGFIATNTLLLIGLVVKNTMKIIPNKYINSKIDSDETLASPNIRSNKQFSLLNDFRKKKYIEWLISKVNIDYKTHFNNIYIIITQEKPDNVIYDELHQYIQKYKNPEYKYDTNIRAKWLADSFKSLIDMKNVKNVLDIGCDNGLILKNIISKDMHGYGIDIHLKKVVNFIEKKNLHYFMADVQKEDVFKKINKKFDLIIISMALHHIPKWKTVIDYAKKYLNKDGYLIIREHDADNNQDKILLDIQDLSYGLVIPEEKEGQYQTVSDNLNSWFISKKKIEKYIKYDIINEKFNLKKYYAKRMIYINVFRK